MTISEDKTGTLGKPLFACFSQAYVDAKKWGDDLRYV